jgi:hypothetical protein
LSKDLWASHPAQSFSCNVRRDLVIAVELTKDDVITMRNQAGSDSTTTTIDRKDVIPRAMRDKEARRSVRVNID